MQSGFDHRLMKPVRLPAILAGRRTSEGPTMLSLWPIRGWDPDGAPPFFGSKTAPDGRSLSGSLFRHFAFGQQRELFVRGFFLLKCLEQQFDGFLISELLR